MSLLAGPQALPYSTAHFVRLLLLYLISGMLVLLPGSEDLFTAMALMLLDLSLLTTFVWFCLYTRNKLPRLQQTLTACFGTGFIFQLLAVPLVLVLNAAPEGANNAVASLFYLLLISWQMAVMAHILRHALDMAIALTLVLSVAYLLLAIFLSNQTVLLLASL